MKALAYCGPGECTLREMPQPVIEAPTDAIVRITKTTIYGTDLHILKGDVPTVTPPMLSKSELSKVAYLQNLNRYGLAN